MGTSYMWYAEEANSPQPYSETPWALEFNERTALRGTRGDWNWEVGMHQDQIAEAEAIRDHTYRAIYGNWSFLKNHSINRAVYARHRLAWVAYVAGKRESRRLLGDVILSQQDLKNRVVYPDAAVSTTWNIDLHYPNPSNSRDFPGQEFRSIAKFEPLAPYAIPYRCFYSRNVENLFMAGRDISVTHVALGTVRVQRTTGMMGEVVGMAAALAHRHNTTPRGVYQNHLDELKTLMKKGVGREKIIMEGAQVPPGFSTAGEWRPGRIGLISGADKAVANWKPPLGNAAPTRIWFQVVPEPGGDRAATIEIVHNGYRAVRRLNMAEGETRWLNLGTFLFTGNGSDFVRLVRQTPESSVQAAAVKFETMRADATTVRSTAVVDAKE